MRIGFWCQTSKICAYQTLTETQVCNTLKKIDVKKSVGWDRMPADILKLSAKTITPSLTNLFNFCIRTGEWPSDWKRGEWTPVFKKDKKYIRKNYRPITTLSTIDKVFEQLITSQTSKRIEGELSCYLTAYRKGNSTETTLIMLIESWKVALDKKEIIGILSTDMSKAFDSMHPPLLLKKLESYGFSEDALLLIRSYFENRQNRVKMGNTRSDWIVSNRGCPQGSSFGPLLWNIFQNDMTYEIRKCKISMYADDHQLFVSGKSIQEVEKELNSDIENASKWYQDNFLIANKDKYQAMVIRENKPNDKEIEVKVNEMEIEQTSSMKLLGVSIDDRLNFTEHIKNVSTRASQRVGVIFRLRNLIPTETKLLLYKTAILPHLTYCDTVWHFCKASDKRKLERVQERALRAVYCDKNSSYNELLRHAKLQTLNNRRLQNIAIMMFKVKHNMSQKYIIDLFQISNKRYDLRNADFTIPRFNTVRYGKHSLRYLGPFLW